MLRVLDLFAGCGGLSLGLQWAGFRPVAAIEKDRWAADTYALNHPNTEVICSDIRELTSEFLRKRFNGQIDMIAGGPPCQGFSISGKRQFGKLLPQNQLVCEYIRAVTAICPPCVLLENVGGFKTGRLRGHENALEFVTRELETLGYKTQHVVLQAADYGVPSLRTRLFLVGSLFGYSAYPFPAPSHGNRLKAYVSAEDALSDLPLLNAGEGSEELVPYATRAKNSFQQLMRRHSHGVWNHVAMRHTPRLVERFKTIAPGSSAFRLSSRDSGTKRVTVYKSNNQRLCPDSPSLCITANFQSNYIHYSLHRNLTAREAARLMTFPDTYRFCGKRTLMSSTFLKKFGRHAENYLSQYNQIGNAVPPLLAKAIGARLGATLNLVAPKQSRIA